MRTATLQSQSKFIKRVDPADKADKGKYKGSCNRQTCQAPGAMYYNGSTQAFYCETCAKKINELNREEICYLLTSEEMKYLY